MKDWDAVMEDAVRAAEKAADTHFVQELLKMVRCGAELPFVSAGGMARLLDIAILIGDADAHDVSLIATCFFLFNLQKCFCWVFLVAKWSQDSAASLSKNGTLWPLRRWRGEDLWLDAEHDVVIAALVAGAELQSIHVPPPEGKASPWCSFGDILLPLQTVAFLSEDSRWRDCASLFPPWPGKLKPKSSKNDLSPCFLEKTGYIDESSKGVWRLSIERLQLADRSGLDIRDVETGLQDINDRSLPGVSLLGLAILLGQPDVASGCAWYGVELSGPDEVGVLRRALEEMACVYFGSRWSAVTNIWERLMATLAAGQVVRESSLRREAVEKGFVVYQVMRKTFGGRSFPVELVHDILLFSMQVPKFFEGFDPWVWKLLDVWMASISSAPSGSVRGMEESETASNQNE